MIIDSHAHVLLPTERQIAAMDEAGIDRTILFTTTVHPERATDVASFEQEMAVLQQILAGQFRPAAARLAAIGELVAAVTAHPQRFLGFGTVPLGLSEPELAAWMTEQVLAHGFRGLGEFTLGPGQVGQLAPIFAAAATCANLPLWVHTFHPLTLADIKELVRLSQRFPSVPLILGHLGGVHFLDVIKLAQEQPQIYLDLSASYTPLAPALAVQALPERTFFSSDAPYGDPLLARQLIERVVRDPAHRRLVLGENIARLLG